ncbi:MAG: phosphatase PAP2 family protein [Actinomycetota bacterium]|nr:phosphatase PAP2 family protein [Actinomycetota bacterium]
MRRAVVNQRGRERAARNAGRIVALERRLGIHVEPELQRLLLPRRRRLVAVLNVAYVTLNVVLTVGSLMRMFFRRDPSFHRTRRATVIGMLAAQPAFLFFPVEPPRKLEHLVDTIEEVTGLDLDSGVVVRLYNPIAAMPSIHMVFAVCTSAGLLASAGSPAIRSLAYAYPAAVAFTVLATANHYVLDIAAGTALAALAVGAGRLSAPR